MKRSLTIVTVLVLLVTGLWAFSNIRKANITNSNIDSSPIGATTPSSGVLTTLGVNIGVSNHATGFQHVVGFASCTTPSGANQACNTSLSWNTAFADTTYTAVCGVNTILSGGEVVITGTGSRTTAGITVQITNNGANTAASQVTLDCIGIHP